jgi:hypothetical protein
MGNTQSDVGDFGRLNSYGLVNRNGVDDIVIIDFGLMIYMIPIIVNE